MLIVEDELLVRIDTRAAIEMAGFDVLEAGFGGDKPTRWRLRLHRQLEATWDEVAQVFSVARRLQAALT